MFDMVMTTNSIPPGLNEMEPGMELAAHLEAIDITRLPAPDQVVVLRARQRMASYYAAQVYAGMVAVSDALHAMEEEDDADFELAAQAAVAEIGAALRMTRRAADTELGLAMQLRRRLPRVWDLLAGGWIDPRRAWVIVDATSHLSTARAREVVDEIADDAPELTTGKLGARIRRLCIDADPAEARERYQAQVRQRRVVCEATTDGTAHLLALDLPPERAAAAARHIDGIARDLNTRDETRTMDQLRADVLIDLLTGSRAARGNGGVVDIRVDLATLAELNESSGDLAGYGPVIADIARQVAEHETRAEWRYAVTDTDAGNIVDVGATRRRPTASQTREVQALHPSCVFPACRMPATRSDIDHRIPHSENGPTITPNLAPLCRTHHRLRHEGGWSYQPEPNGDLRWTSRLGQTYTTSGTPP